jgi:riboflavin kinase/FMN adenylyltransferase
VTAPPPRLDLDAHTPLPDSWRGAFLSVGNFDGVHLGHADLAARLLRAARAAGPGVPALAVTFDPHPVSLLRPSETPPPLTTTDRKVELLLAAGLDGVVVFRTGPWLLDMTARAFFDEVLVGRFAPRGLIEGPTFGFGRDRQGTPDRLSSWCPPAGISFEVAPPISALGDLISSSRIRQALSSGRLDEANSLLGRPHRLTGLVVHGAGRGAGLGFPTANLADIPELIPSDGVYASLAHVPGFPSPIPAATHIGANSTFGETHRSVESHLLDFSSDLYGLPLSLSLLSFLRPSQHFPDLPSLLSQIHSDLSSTRLATSRFTP